MAKKTPEKITRLKKKKPTRPCFFCCFGFSRKEKFSDNRSSVKSFNSRKGTIGLFSWSVFRMKNSSTKTVPLDTSDRSTDLSESKIHSSKSSNFKSKWKIPKLFSKRTNNSTTKATPFREVPTIVTQIIEERTQGPEQNNTPENRRSFDHVDTLKDSTCRKRLSFRRKVDAIRTGSSQRGSPGVIIKPNPKPARTNTTATLSHSVSMPILTGEKRVNPLSKVRVLPKKTRDDDSVMMFNKFDPVVGMSIIVVTLIIMFIWGQLCAVLCTSAWLYFVPRLRGLKNYDAMMKIDGDLDLNSEEYKKKVVLEGFLDRDHRAVL